MSHCHKHERTFWSRKDFLMQSGGGVAGLAFADLLQKEGLLAAAPEQLQQCDTPFPGAFEPRPPHFDPRAKAVISLFMSGGVSQVDTFDYKPALTKYAGEPLHGGDRVQGHKAFSAHL